jgi:hypothetical protein
VSKRPRPPDDLPAGNGHTGPAAAPPPAAARPGPRPALLVGRWAIILRRFRDHMHQRDDLMAVDPAARRLVRPA